MQVKITYQGKTKSFLVGMTFYDVAKDFQVTDAIAVQMGNVVASLDMKIKKDTEIEFLNGTTLSGYKMYQAGLKFLFLVAVKEEFQGSEVTFLHSVPKGILCEIAKKEDLTKEDVSKIKNAMAKMVEEKLPITKYHLDVKEAINYLLEKGYQEKAMNIQSLSNEVVTMYRLKNELNYFYNLMPYDTSVLSQFELIFLGKNRVVLVCPNVVSGTHIPEYVHYENIVQNFMATKSWLKKMGVSYLAQMNELVSHLGTKDFILSNEMAFDEDLREACDKITSLPEIKIVLIAGPSSSGKTTTMKRLSAILRSRGADPVMLSTDDFFVDRENTPKNELGEYDYECLEAIDLPLFHETLQNLLKKEEVTLPEYDFVSGKKRISKRKVKLKENSILMIEGLHSLNDDLIPYIDQKNKFKIYLSPFIPLNIDRHNYISTLDLRLLRRIVRDNRTRGKTVSDTIGEWQMVRSGEEKYIFPYVYQADMIINTALAYEVGVLKVYVLPLLHSVGIDSIYYHEARRLILSLQVFFDIPSEYVPNNSILREFIGEER